MTVRGSTNAAETPGASVAGRLVWSCAVAALLGALMGPARAQQAGHAAGDITPMARKLNQLFGGDSIAAEKGFESEDRAIFRKRFEVLDALSLKPGMQVADVGAGSGFFTRLMAERVGPTGTAYGVEISGLLVSHIERTARAQGIRNVKAVLGTAVSPNLPAQSVDVALVVDSYHHFEFPREMLKGIRDALRPQGVLWLIDFDRIEGVSHPFILQDVRAGRQTFIREFSEAGFELADEVKIFDDEYVLKFRRRSAGGAGRAAARTGR